jgi:hypothetical protein
MSLNNKKSSSDDKYIRTTMIGAISAIEDIFGKYWGIQKDPDDRSNKEVDFYESFMDLRERILDLGNIQIEKFNRRNNKRN